MRGCVRVEYIVRELKECEYGMLNDFLYEAIYVPEGAKPPSRDIIARPELQVYVEAFGSRMDDIAFAAQADGRLVGAVWVREMNDYGHIEDGVPSFAISVYKEYRGMGIGTAMMQAMLDELRSRGYEKASLAVQKANYAVRMYEKAGFVIVGENEEEYLMMCRLNSAAAD